MRNIFLIFFLFNIINSINLPWLVNKLSKKDLDNFKFECYPQKLYQDCKFDVLGDKSEVQISYKTKREGYSIQRLTIKKKNDNLYILNGTNRDGEMLKPHHRREYEDEGRFNFGILRSISKDQASVFLRQETTDSQALYILVKAKLDAHHTSGDIDTEELIVNCEEKGVSVKNSLDNNRVEISGESINISHNHDLITFFEHLKSRSSNEFVSNYKTSKHGSYEYSLFLLSLILHRTQVTPSIIRIYCTPQDDCLANEHNQRYALIIRNKDDGKDYIIDNQFGLRSISLNEWIESLNPRHNAKLCLFNLSPQTLSILSSRF